MYKNLVISFNVYVIVSLMSIFIKHIKHIKHIKTYSYK
jgi:hypothetical protein